MTLFVIAAVLAGDFACPDGTRERDRTTAEAREKWCEKPDGTRHGPRWAWHADGGQWFRGQYTDGERSGDWTFWHPGGKKRSQSSYRADKRHGHFVEWHESGTKILEGDCADGVETGTWTRWWPNGKLELRATFREGAIAGEPQCGSRRGLPVTLEQLADEKTRGSAERNKRLLAQWRRNGGFEECAN